MVLQGGGWCRSCFLSFFNIISKISINFWSSEKNMLFKGDFMCWILVKGEHGSKKIFKGDAITLWLKEYIHKSWIMSFFLNLFLFFLFLAALDLCCCAQAFSSWGEWGYSLLWCAGFSLRWLLLLRSMGSRCTGSVVVVHGLSCSVACGIFLDQGSNPCPLHWQADS